MAYSCCELKSSLYALKLTYSGVSLGATEQTLGTHTHLDQEPRCLTHTVITSLIKEELYKMTYP